MRREPQETLGNNLSAPYLEAPTCLGENMSKLTIGFLCAIIVGLAVGTPSKALAQDPCSLVLNSVTPDAVQAYNYFVTWANGFNAAEFKITANGSGFGPGLPLGPFCADGTVTTQGISNPVQHQGLTVNNDGTGASVYLRINDASNGCPPSCLQFGEQTFALTDFWGVQSGNVTYTVDYPGYMVVRRDIFVPVGLTHIYPLRWTQYEVHDHYRPGDLAAQIQIGEDNQISGWNCDQHFNFTTTSCTQSPRARTGDDGTFWDRWGVTGFPVMTPPGCGGNLLDHCQVCQTDWNAGAWTLGQQLPQQTFGTLTGYIHTDSIGILGYDMPPATNQMPDGFRIDP